MFVASGTKAGVQKHFAQVMGMDERLTPSIRLMFPSDKEGSGALKFLYAGET